MSAKVAEAVFDMEARLVPLGLPDSNEDEDGVPV